MNFPSDPAGEPGGADQSEEAHRESEASDFSELETASVVLAIFPDRRAAERTVLLLGGAFRRKARRGHAGAFVVTGDRHGSFSIAQSRVVTRSGLVAAAACSSRSWRGFVASSRH